MSNKLKLGYWDIRALAEPIRLLLHYVQVDFEDKRYAFDSGEWLQDKFNLGLDFPNLPYLFDGNRKLTQSNTILRYLAKKYNLDGKTEDEKIKVSLIEQQVVDLRWMLFFAMIPPDFEKGKSELAEKLPSILEAFVKFLGDKDFLVGEGVTYVDFLAAETFDFYRYFTPEVFNKYPTLKAYQIRVMSLPQLQKYFSSSTYKRWPLFGPKAKFGGGGEEPSRD